MMRLLLTRMRDLDERYVPRLKDLTEPEAFAMSRWVYQSGECYAAIVFEGSSPELSEDEIVSWAVLTWEDGPHPVLGAYTDEEYRRQGYGQVAVRALLELLKRGIAASGGVVQADTNRWPAYKRLVREQGYVCWMWE